MDKNYLKKLQQFQKTINIFFNHPELLERALTHPSYTAEHEGKNHNQRLEFLGDAILNSVVAEYLYHHYPNQPEGRLSKMRAAVVCEPTLARVAERLGLGIYLRLGRGEELSGGRTRPSNLADALEALAGAVFLDQGWKGARSFLHNLFEGEIKKTAQGIYPDYKTALQEIIQQQGNEQLTYVILSESGPDHAKHFTSGVIWRGHLLGKGSGGSKKESEQQAARAALEQMRNKTNRSEKY